MEKALAVGVLLGREHVRTLELGIPSKVGRKPGVIQLVWAVEPLVREPGLGKRGPVSRDPLVVSDAGGQVVRYIQELELGSVNEHDATVLLRSEDPAVMCHDRDKVLADKLEIVVARVEADHRHLVNPVHDEVALGDGDSLWVGREVTLCNIGRDGCMAPLKRLVEEMDQLVGTQAQGLVCPQWRRRWVRARSQRKGRASGRQPWTCLGMTRSRRQSRGGKSPSASQDNGWLPKGLGLRALTSPSLCIQRRVDAGFVAK